MVLLFTPRSDMCARSRLRRAISIIIPLRAAPAHSQALLGVGLCSSAAFHRSFVILTLKLAKQPNSRINNTQGKAPSLVAVLLLSKFLQYRTERYDFLRIRLKSPWFNISSTVVGCCSAARKTNTAAAAQSIASPGIVIANSACYSHNTCSRYQHHHTRSNNHTIPAYPILGSSCAVSLLCISRRQWPLILYFWTTISSCI